MANIKQLLVTQLMIVVMSQFLVSSEQINLSLSSDNESETFEATHEWQDIKPGRFHII